MTFNRMLDRLESAVTAQRQFLADAGHELRTPITIIQGNLDTLTAAGDDAEALAIASDELARMTRLVDELLLLASSERPDFLRMQSVGPGSHDPVPGRQGTRAGQPALGTGGHRPAGRPGSTHSALPRP